MSQASALLDSLEELYNSPADRPYIVIDEERFINVPETLRRLAVQYDHNVGSVTFKCPRYWDGNDMSQMRVYINYICSNGFRGQYPVDHISVEENVMYFDWIISANATRAKGPLAFLVCIVKTDENGNEERHWNSEINQDCYISEGLDCLESTAMEYPDVITYMLLKMDKITDKAIILVDDVTGENYKLHITNGELRTTLLT